MFSNQIAFTQIVEELGGHRMLKVPNLAWRAPWRPINDNCRSLGIAEVAKT